MNRKIVTPRSRRYSVSVRRASFVLLATVFLAVGSFAPLASQAVSNYMSIEAESGSRSAQARVVSDVNASGGSYINFDSPQTGGGGNPTGNFYIVGKDIIGPDGNKFYPMGANVGIQGYFDWRGVANGRSNDVLAWGWNTVRLTILCTNIVAAPATDAVIESFIQEYTAKKIVVMIECHDMTMANLTSQWPNAAVPGLEAFWTRMAQKYKNNTYVWFNPQNEPFWGNNEGWVAFHKHFLNLVRAQGAENIFVADNMNMGNDAGWDGAKRVYDPSMGPAVKLGQCNVMFAMHAYGGVADNGGTQEYYTNVQNAGLALIIGEVGYTTNGSSTAGSYDQNVRGTNQVFQYSAEKGVGILWWHATHGDMYSLKNNGNAFFDGGNSANLSPAGQTFWNLSHNKPNLGAYTGSYGASGCPSAIGG